MKVFLPDPPAKNSIIKHKDGNKYNNHIDNLYWFTPNIDDKWKEIIIDGEATNLFVNKLGQVKNGKTGNIYKGDTSKEYQYYTLRYNHKQKIKSAHRLVAEAFLPNPNNYKFVHHKDHNPFNNNVENLEWANRNEEIAGQTYATRESCYSLTWNSLPNEQWRNYKNTHYAVSNLGRVRNLQSMKIIKGTLRADGYVGCSIGLVHVIVVEAFIRELKPDEDINHVNGIKTDNRIENLQIVSHQENMRRAAEQGKCGAKKVGRFDKDNNLIKTYNSASEAARDLDILPSSTRNIINYRNGKRGDETFKYI